MKACTFFGHRDCPEWVRESLRDAVAGLLSEHHDMLFYVGNQGRFDEMARSVLRETGANYAVVLAYVPEKTDADWSDTLLPEGIENVPRRFAISWRNRWMIEQSDFVISYTTHSWGGAAQFTELARKMGRTEIRLEKIG